MGLVKFTLAMTILTIIVAISMLIGIAVTYQPELPDSEIVDAGEEIFPKFNVEVSTAVIPGADGKVPEGGVSLDGGDAIAAIPEGVQLMDGVTEVSLSVNSMETETEVELEENESARSVDVHIEGISENNEVPMLVTLKKIFTKGLNSTSVKMFHVEKGSPVEMILVDNPTNHNEFSYDPATGNVVMTVASFSEYVVVEDDKNPWEGKANVTWYNDTDTEFTLTSAEQLAGFGLLVDEGNTFEGKTIKLGNDINLYGTDAEGNPLSFNPIGFKWISAKDDEGNSIGKNFQGTFDGQNHTIENLYQNGWAMGLSYSNAGGGLFAGIYNATIKNLTMKGADIVMEAVPMGTVAAYAYGECTFDNIRITESTLQNYNWDIAAVVGGVNGKHTFSNITIDNSVTLSSLWGSFGGGIGGVIGSVYGGNNGNNSITMDNVQVACVLDVYNDVTSAYQWYAYRFCGMLIGNTNEPGADGKNAYVAQASFLNCSNVKVYYGDWINYHYCKFSNQSVDWQNGYPWVRVEEGLSNSAYSNARYGHPVVDGVAVTDETHSPEMHKEGDDCNLLITFDQLYGGDQGVYGQPEHDGVTIYHTAYTITYIVDGEVYAVRNVYEEEAKSAVNVNSITIDEATSNNREFQCWLNMDSQRVDEIKAGNTKNIILYCSWADEYIARFVDNDGNVYAEIPFTKDKEGNVTFDAAAVPNPPAIAGYSVRWEPYADAMKEATSDIIVKPMYTIDDSVSVLDSNISLADLFKKLADGEKLAMSQNMTGKSSGGNQSNQCTIKNTTARLNLNTYELSFTQGSNANKTWRLFSIASGGKFTLGTGINGTGKLVFNINSLNSNGSAQIFVIQQGGQLVLEKGVVIEINFSSSYKDKITLITGITNLDTVNYPGLYIVKTDTSYRIEVYETTTLTGNDPTVNFNN